MKFAFSANAFRRYSLAETIAHLADAGYQGIEIMADIPHAYPPDLTAQDIRAIRQTLARHHLEIANINAFMLYALGDTYHPSWIEQDPAKRAARIEYTRQCIDLAAELGAHTLSTEPGGPRADMEPEEGLALFRKGLLAVQEQARARGVRLLIEPEPGLLIENSRQFLDFFQGLDPEVFGLNFDIGHFFCVNEDPAPLVRELLPYIAHFHLEDIAATRVHHHLMLGEGAIDLPAMLAAIEGIGYAGFVTVELYPYEDQPMAAARKAMAYLAAYAL